MLEVAVLYGCDLSQVFTPIILRLYQPHSLREKGATKAAAKAALYVFLLPPLREGRQQFFTKPQVDLYDQLLKIHIFQINTFCILQYSFENFKDYFVGSARTSRKNVYGKGWR